MGYKNWYRGKKKAFTKHAESRKNGDAKLRQDLEKITKHCQVVRVLAHTQISKTPLKQKKAHLMEIQINGGTVEEKVTFGFSLFEQNVPVDTVFHKNEMVDTIGVTKGK